MKAAVLDNTGKKKKDIELPLVFNTPYRPDLIKRAVISIRANRRQKYGANERAGKRTSARYFGSRHVASDKMMMNRGMARMPRLFGDTAGHLKMAARFVPQAVGGRKAHPPKSAKNWNLKINMKEKLLAIKSAIAGTGDLDLIKIRNHAYDGGLPIIVEDSLQKMNKTKDVTELLNKLGFEEELKRVSKKKIREGKGKTRGRRFKIKKGPVIVITKDEGIGKIKNIAGVEIINVKRINTETLSPGAHGIRAVIWTESSINELKQRFG